MDELDLVYDFELNETKKLRLMPELYKTMMKEDNWVPTF